MFLVLIILFFFCRKEEKETGKKLAELESQLVSCLSKFDIEIKNHLQESPTATFLFYLQTTTEVSGLKRLKP